MRKLERFNIGEGDEHFDHRFPQFTQVIIVLNGTKIAHFTGMYAKQSASVFMEAIVKTDIGMTNWSFADSVR